MKKTFLSIAVAFVAIFGLDATAQNNCPVQNCCNSSEMCERQENCAGPDKCVCPDKCEMTERCGRAETCSTGNDCCTRQAKYKKHKGHRGHRGHCGDGFRMKRSNPMDGITLTPAQQKKFDELREKQQNKNRKEFDKIRSERDKRRQEFDKKVKEILTPEQYAKYQENKRQSCDKGPRFNGDCKIKSDCDASASGTCTRPVKR